MRKCKNCLRPHQRWEYLDPIWWAKRFGTWKGARQRKGARYSGVTLGKVLGGYMYYILWNTLGVAQDASDHQDENTF